MPITIKYNRTTNHLDGLDIRTAAADQTEEQISATGEVAYYAENACGSLTRYRFADGQSFDTVGEALEAARASSRKLCKTCERAAEAMLAAESANITSDSNAEEGEIMAEMKSNDVSTGEGKAVLEEINAAIERASSLAEAENAEALEELATETKALIAGLGGKGSAAIKKAKAAEFDAAATMQEKPKASKAKAEPKAEVVIPSYKDFEGLPELVEMGAQKTAEGVTLHRKVTDIADDLAAITLDMAVRLPDKDGRPDIKGEGEQTRNAWKDMNADANKGFERSFENEQIFYRLQRAVQEKRADRRAALLRSLDDEGSEQLETFKGVLEGKPAGVSASRWVADQYGTPLIGPGERKKIMYHINKKDGSPLPDELLPLVQLEPALLALASGTGAGTEEDPDATITHFVDKIYSEVGSLKKDILERVSEDAKDKNRPKLEELNTAIKELLRAMI